MKACPDLPYVIGQPDDEICGGLDISRPREISGSDLRKVKEGQPRTTSPSSGEPQKEDGIVSNHYLSEHAESSVLNVGSPRRNVKESG